MDFTGWADSTLINYYVARRDDAALSELERRGKLCEVNAALVDLQLELEEMCEGNSIQNAKCKMQKDGNNTLPRAALCVLLFLFFSLFLTGCNRVASDDGRVSMELPAAGETPAVRERQDEPKAEVVELPGAGETPAVRKDYWAGRGRSCSNLR